MVAPSDIVSFTLDGHVWPLLKGRSAALQHTRPMAGWLMTYGKLTADGIVVPTVDREGHVMEAARELGLIDFSDYLRKGVGVWNDTHKPEIIVGLPDTLEFHDGSTAMSKAHGKVGFWTSGHLFDRTDPGSWDGLRDDRGRPRVPTPQEFSRADHFWRLSQLLKGTPRPLALSADGSMWVSRCGGRIVRAKVEAAAVCELPQNPDTTLEPMLMSVAGTPLDFLRPGMVSGEFCRCGDDSCSMSKAVHAGSSSMAAMAPEDLEGSKPDDGVNMARLVDMVAERFKLSQKDAQRWVADYLKRMRGERHERAA